MKIHVYYIAVFFFAVSIILITCGERKQNDPCPIDPGIVPNPPYDNPTWHPSGSFIGFNHTPLRKISYPYGEGCWGEQEFTTDSAGFWLINPDGTNMHRIFPYTFLDPAWSPDGQWIAFDLGAQIYKMKFTGTTFDTLTLTQLTTEGRNFYPVWSPDGQWLAYNKSVCDGPSTCGIWLMDATGLQNRFLVSYGNTPSWHPSGTNIIYWTVSVTQQGQIIGDSLWTFDINSNSRSFMIFLSGLNRDARHAIYSPDSTKIAFWTNGNLWLRDSTGGLQQITSLGVDVDFGLPFSWSPSGTEIIYTRYRFGIADWTYDNGVLWLINVATGAEKQITYNIRPTE